MTHIPFHHQWLEDTRLSLFRRRSPALRALDEAILQYERSATNGNLWRLYYALEEWKRSAGPAWPASAPNRKRAITLLDREIARAGDAWARRHLEAGAVAKSARVDTRHPGELRGRHRAARVRTA